MSNDMGLEETDEAYEIYTSISSEIRALVDKKLRHVSVGQEELIINLLSDNFRFWRD